MSNRKHEDEMNLAAYRGMTRGLIAFIEAKHYDDYTETGEMSDMALRSMLRELIHTHMEETR